MLPLKHGPWNRVFCLWKEKGNFVKTPLFFRVSHILRRWSLLDDFVCWFDVDSVCAFKLRQQKFAEIYSWPVYKLVLKQSQIWGHRDLPASRQPIQDGQNVAGGASPVIKNWRIWFPATVVGGGRKGSYIHRTFIYIYVYIQYPWRVLLLISNHQHEIKSQHDSSIQSFFWGLYIISLQNQSTKIVPKNLREDSLGDQHRSTASPRLEIASFNAPSVLRRVDPALIRRRLRISKGPFFRVPAVNFPGCSIIQIDPNGRFISMKYGSKIYQSQLRPRIYVAGLCLIY